MRVHGISAWLVAALVCPVAALSAGCSKNYVQSDTALARVIVYRNGVAYFERSAVLEDDHLEMTVPDQQLDDFLKSLSVHDAATGELAPVSYQTNARGSVDLNVRLSGPAPHRIKLSYVTEAPAWKPSYRVTIGRDKRLKFQAWAIVDNTSGEDWNGVKLGVSSGSALSFKYDLRSVRTVVRDRLEPQGLVAFAPPTGGSVYGTTPAASPSTVVVELNEKALAALETEEKKALDPSGVFARVGNAERSLKRLVDEARAQKDVVKTLCLNDKLTQITAVRRVFNDQKGNSASGAVSSALGQRADQLIAEANQCIGEEAGYVGSVSMSVESSTDGETAKTKAPPAKRGPMGGVSGPAEDPAPQRSEKPADNATAQLRNLEQRVAELKAQIYRSNARIRLISNSQLAGSVDDAARRGEVLKNRLVRSGIPADRVIVDARQAADGQAGGLSIVMEPIGAASPVAESSRSSTKKLDLSTLDPIQSSIFEVSSALDVPRNSSVMLALYSGEVEGESVYYYDAESPRGNASFPFRAVRMKNPTRATLESGPVSVVSDGRFLGEGVNDPIPAGTTAFVPYALDRQIVAERETSENDAISRIVSVRRGVFTTRVDRTKKTRVTLFNRADAPAVVYVRHTLAAGYALRKGPPNFDRIGGARLFRVELAAKAKQEIEIAEAAPLERTTDIRTPDGAKLLRAYVDGPDVDPKTKTAVIELVKIADDIGTMSEQLGGKRAQQKELRERLHELHAEVVTLKTVKSSGKLLQDLEKKLQETSNRVSKSTSDIVELEEKIMIHRIRLGDAIAEFRMEG